MIRLLQLLKFVYVCQFDNVCRQDRCLIHNYVQISIQSSSVSYLIFSSSLDDLTRLTRTRRPKTLLLSSYTIVRGG